MEIVVIALRAPAGKVNSILPSGEEMDPPDVPILLLIWVPIGVPIAVVAAGRSGSSGDESGFAGREKPQYQKQATQVYDIVKAHKKFSGKLKRDNAISNRTKVRKTLLYYISLTTPVLLISRIPYI